MAPLEPLPDWEREFLQNQHVAPPEKCDHAWASKHEPGHLLYWVRQCMICHEVDWDDLDTEIGKLTMATPADYEYRVLRIPRGTGIDGAIVELNAIEGGQYVFTADIRIPARQDERADFGPEGDLLEAAWGLIANAGHGDWTRESADWQQAAAKWRERLFSRITVRPDEEEDLILIRDAMTEAHDHPGRVVTR